MKTLTAAQRRELKGRAHALRPIVMISDEGLSAGVLAEVERGLKSHELIKIRVFTGGHDERESMLAAICQQTGAEPVQHIGKMLVIYRKKPPEASLAARPVQNPRSPRPSGEVRFDTARPRRPRGALKPA